LWYDLEGGRQLADHLSVQLHEQSGGGADLPSGAVQELDLSPEPDVFEVTPL